jgi:hypothetical protein
MNAGVLQDDGKEDAGEGDDRADRQVDAARDDHEGHADRGDAEEGVVGQRLPITRVDSMFGYCSAQTA